jgi:hypothetical protein
VQPSIVAEHEKSDNEQMNEPPISGTIEEPDGTSYSVNLWTVPRVGELIDLTSHVEIRDKQTFRKNYEVVQVIHRVFDVDYKMPELLPGHHAVQIFVKPSSGTV